MSGLQRLPSRAEWEEGQRRAAAHQEAQQEIARQRAARAARRREYVRTPKGKRVVAATAVATVALIVALAVVLPVGPKVSRQEIEASVLETILRTAPPSSPVSGGEAKDSAPMAKVFFCEGGEIVTTEWTCHIEQDIGFFPDANTDYSVSVGNDRCWVARVSDDNDAPFEGDALLGDRHQGCIGR